MLGAYRSMLAEMDRVVAAIEAGDCESYRKGVASVASLTHQACDALHRDPK